MIKNNLRRFGVGLTVIAFWLGVWSLACWLLNQSLNLPLPYPWDVVAALGELLHRADFWSSVGWSLWRIVCGFFGAVAVGAILAMLTVRFRLLHVLFSPALSVIRSVPVASFIFLMFIWMHPDTIPTVIAFLMVLPLVWENVRQGIMQTDTKLLEMARVFRMSRFRQMRFVWIPSLKPYWRSALSTGFGFAWKSGVAAEIICTTGDSIGAQIAAAKSIYNYDEVFAGTAVVVVLSVVMEWLMRRLTRKWEVVE